jgi:damage-control phosphatase, subfamily I
MKTHLECLSCLMKQSTALLGRLNLQEKTNDKIIDEISRAIGETDSTQSPPLLMGEIHRMIKNVTGLVDPYEKAKENCNRNVMKFNDDWRELIDGSPNPLLSSVRLAIAGNTLDLAVDPNADQANIKTAAMQSLVAVIPALTLAKFVNDLNNASKILYLGDNAGEIVFDRLLLELLPVEKVTFVVRGQPVINDVTILDAQVTGITNLVRVIDNGSDLPGTVLSMCSESFQREFHEADLVIAKGQGNFESLNEEKKNIFFLFKVKCSVVEGITGYPIGTHVFMNLDSLRA